MHLAHEACSETQNQCLLLMLHFFPQVQLLTLLVQLEEVPGKQVRDVYKLLLDDSYNIRHAAAELVADMLEESGQRHLGQVYSHAPSASHCCVLHKLLLYIVCATRLVPCGLAWCIGVLIYYGSFVGHLQGMYDS